MTNQTHGPTIFHEALVAGGGLLIASIFSNDPTFAWLAENAGRLTLATVGGCLLAICVCLLGKADVAPRVIMGRVMAGGLLSGLGTAAAGSMTAAGNTVVAVVACIFLFGVGGPVILLSLWDAINGWKEDGTLASVWNGVRVGWQKRVFGDPPPPAPPVVAGPMHVIIPATILPAPPGTVTESGNHDVPAIVKLESTPGSGILPTALPVVVPTPPAKP